MAEKRSLNHFALFSLTSTFWEADAATQHDLARELPQRLRGIAEQVHGYRVFPTRRDADFLVWSAVHSEAADVAGQFFSGFAEALAPFRRFVKPADTLWGFTRPSVYAGGRTTQEIDPFVAERKPYLVIYPFAKTVDWYLMSRDSRQGMMNEHIRIGREYPEIMQLLLYTTGLQDQEFVVSYETTDLVQFSELVTTLRNTDARQYTLRDTPIYTAVYQPLDKVLPLTER